mgnify:CR=1 FL=1
MKLGNDLLQKKFDDIDGKIDLMIDYCRSLQSENRELKEALHKLETQMEETNASKTRFLQNETLIQARIDGLLGKLNQFSNS